MLNKKEREEWAALQRENEYLRKKVNRLEDAKEKAEETISDLDIAIENLEMDIRNRLESFKKYVVERLTGEQFP